MAGDRPARCIRSTITLPLSAFLTSQTHGATSSKIQALMTVSSRRLCPLWMKTCPRLRPALPISRPQPLSPAIAALSLQRTAEPAQALWCPCRSWPIQSESPSEKLEKLLLPSNKRMRRLATTPPSRKQVAQTLSIDQDRLLPQRPAIFAARRPLAASLPMLTCVDLSFFLGLLGRLLTMSMCACHRLHRTLKMILRPRKKRRLTNAASCGSSR